jgi:alkanesulfonate monooxygenase SsuD/methylene tetrahydromethanopterin reductase-like flavin-dependent oxidoreductase (luciferase family)
MPRECPIIGGSEREARGRLAELGNFLDPAAALQVLSERVGHDLAGYDLDAPVPELPASGMMLGHAVTLMAMAGQDNLTPHQLRDIAATAMGHRLLLCPPEQVADGLEAWFDAGAADGFNIMPPWFPGAFHDFVDQVVLIVGKRGLFRGLRGENVARASATAAALIDEGRPVIRASAGSELST